MPNVQTTDNTSHPVLAIVKLDSGKTVKYPKVKPVGSSFASDAAWQTAMNLEVAAAVNQTMNGAQRNATHHLAGLV